VIISCNPDGTVHWAATVNNPGNCAQTRAWKTQLLQKVLGEGGFQRIRVRRDTATSQPRISTVTGDFCVNFNSAINKIRVEFSIDRSDQSCNPHLKSVPIDPCQHTGACSLSFSDLADGDPYQNAVTYLHDSGIVSGYEDGTFRPYNQVTRAQVAKIVVLAFGLPLVTPAQTQRFTDVAAEDVFRPYIETAYAHGLVSGYEDGTFRPNNNVTRGQLTKIVVEAAGLKLANPQSGSFSDVGEESPFYSYIETAYAHGLLAGYPDGTFRADEQANRGQVCKLTLLGAEPPQE